MTQSTQEMKKLSPFFEEINKYDEPKTNIQHEEEMIGKSSNRVLDKKWNIKIQVGADFFSEIFRFIKEMGFNVVIGLTSRQVRLYKFASDSTHMTYITIDKTEMSEYINTDLVLDSFKDENKDEIENETIIYVEFDMIDELTLNNKYPVDIYFDTKEKHHMYIVNGKTLESRRLEDNTTKSDPSLNTYESHYSKILTYLKNENMVNLTVSYVSLGNVLSILEKKKTKKDKKSEGFIKIKFSPSEIDFMVSTDTSSTSVQMYGDDIAIRASKETFIILQLDSLVKFNKLKLSSNVIINVYEKLPFIIETRLGAGKIKVYYVIAPRIEEE